MTPIIPVIDLLHGEVVRAVRGERKTYRPIRSTLCAGSEPLAIARALCRHGAARQLYVADLDALLGGAVQVDILRGLLRNLPEIDELWLDGGFADRAAADAVLAALGPLAGRVAPVFGSESLCSAAALAECFDLVQRQEPESLLSLDRRDGQRLDHAGCWDAVQLWPRRVIVMTLEQVGAGAGPDLATLGEVRRRAPRAMLIGAGGVRDAADLADAQAAGADAWLVASALHDGRLHAGQAG
ncbi:MAG: HisA/HisF-related TIM barrel protein [Rhizobacter sp.]|nr:HisA/HisF-related TIM barrel protein [Rhizobacter sp.]